MKRFFFFCSTELWEVGSYLLVQLHTEEAICDTLRRWCNILESAEEIKNGIEQGELQSSNPVPVPVPILSPIPDLDQYFNDSDIDLDLDGPGIDDNEGDDRYDVVDEDEETEEVNPYLTMACPDTSANANPALASATLGSYI